MPPLTLFESVKTEAYRGASFGCLAAALLIGVHCVRTLVTLRLTQDKYVQYKCISDMYAAFEFAGILPAMGTIVGSARGMLLYAKAEGESIRLHQP